MVIDICPELSYNELWAYVNKQEEMEQARWVKALSVEVGLEWVLEQAAVEAEWVAVRQQTLLDSAYARNVTLKWSEDNDRKTEDDMNKQVFEGGEEHAKRRRNGPDGSRPCRRR